MTKEQVQNGAAVGKRRIVFLLPGELLDCIRQDATDNKRKISSQVEWILERHYDSKAA